MSEDITNTNVEELLQEWVDTQQMMRQIKAEEMELRKQLVQFLVPDAVIGVHTRGFTTIIVKATLKLNHKFDEQELEEHYDDLSDLEKEAVKYKPSLSLSAYKKIPDELRQQLDEMLIVTPAAPTLSVSYRGPEDDG